MKHLFNIAFCIVALLFAGHGGGDVYAGSIELDNEALVLPGNQEGGLRRFPVTAIFFASGPEVTLTSQDLSRVEARPFSHFGVTDLTQANSLLQIRVTVGGIFPNTDLPDRCRVPSSDEPRIVFPSCVTVILVDPRNPLMRPRFTTIINPSDVPGGDGLSTVFLRLDRFNSLDSLNLTTFLERNNGVDFFFTVGADLRPTSSIITGINLTIISDAPHAIPEPATIFLLGTGLAGIIAGVRKRRKGFKSDANACSNLS